MVWLLLLISTSFLIFAKSSETVQSTTFSYNQSALLAFDCSQPGAATLPIDLLEVSSCAHVPDPLPPQHTAIKLIQADPRSEASITQCSVFRSSILVRCGMHSHQMILRSPTTSEPLQLSVNDCLELSKTFRWEYSPQKYVTIPGINTTTRFSNTEFGSIGPHGTCSGSEVVINGITYPSAVRLDEYIITVIIETSTVDISTNSIFLQNGLKCEFNKGFCLDEINGLTIWEAIPPSSCRATNLYDLYCGKATIVPSNEVNFEDSLLRINDSITMFLTFRLHKLLPLCGHQVYSTDFQNLYVHIVNRHNGHIIEEAKQLPARFLKPLLYTNVKLTYSTSCRMI